MRWPELGQVEKEFGSSWYPYKAVDGRYYARLHVDRSVVVGADDPAGLREQIRREDERLTRWA